MSIHIVRSERKTREGNNKLIKKFLKRLQSIMYVITILNQTVQKHGLKQISSTITNMLLKVYKKYQKKRLLFCFIEEVLGSYVSFLQHIIVRFSSSNNLFFNYDLFCSCTELSQSTQISNTSPLHQKILKFPASTVESFAVCGTHHMFLLKQDLFQVLPFSSHFRML